MQKKYDAYKSFDDFWIDAIPANWSTEKMKYMFDEISDKNHPEEVPLVASQHMGVVPKTVYALRTVEASKGLENFKLVKVGDFVISLRSFQGGLEYAYYQGIISPAYTILRSTKKIELNYYKYLAKSYPYISLLKTCVTGIREGQNIDYSVLKNHVMPIPPRAEQDQIVRYLDWKVAEMNHFIHEKKKQIKRLEELKIAKIDELITKGENPSVVMKPSDVEWLGDIPAHWDVDHIKQHFTVKKRIAGKEGYDVLSITQQGLKVKDISSNEGQMAMDYSGYQFVYPGDFAMNHMDLITGYVDLSDKFGVTSPDYRVFSLDDTEHCFAPFYLRVFQIGYKRRIFYKFGKGAANQGRWRLPKTAFYDYSIQVPPLEEQMEIEKACLKLEKDIDSMIDGIRKEIELVEELRVKTIADVVTGQVDVRNVIIPEYTTDDGTDDDFDSDDIDDDSDESDVDEE